MAIPSVLKAYACFIDGRGYAGKADVELPELTVTTEEYAAGGMAGKVKLDMGLVEALDAKVTLYDYAPEVLSQWGLANGGAVAMVFRGAKQADDGSAPVPIKVSMLGIRLRTDRDIFARCHRHGTSNEARCACDKYVRRLCGGRGDADYEARG